MVALAPAGSNFDLEMDRAGGLPSDLLHEELDDWDHIAARGLKGMLEGGLGLGGGVKQGASGEGQEGGKGGGEGKGDGGEGGGGGAYGEGDEGASQGAEGKQEASDGAGAEDEDRGRGQRQKKRGSHTGTSSSSSSSSASSSSSSAMSGFNSKGFETSLKKSFPDRAHRSIIKIEEDQSCSVPRPLKPCRLPAGERIHVVFVSAMWNREAHTKVGHSFPGLASHKGKRRLLSYILVLPVSKERNGTCIVQVLEPRGSPQGASLISQCCRS